MNHPLVTIICLCYNQARFVEEAIDSVLNQVYKNIELIVVDDASQDDSAEVIRAMLVRKSRFLFVPLEKNIGSCKAFNHALSLAKGQMIIDLAADDVLLPLRVQRGVEALTSAGNNCGVNFSDAEWIAENGSHLYFHSDKFPHASISQGNIYKDVIQRFFICSPTVMFTRKVIDDLGGYDEQLAYEDFDFWIRSSRNYLYCYTPEVLVQKRVVRNSMSAQQFTRGSTQLYSTYLICEKIFALNRSYEEQKALQHRILYEIRVSARLLRFDLVKLYLRLLLRNWRKRF